MNPTHTLHHTGQFPLPFDLVAERGNSLVQTIRFVPMVDFSAVTLVWLIQQGDTPLLALQVSTDAASSRLSIDGDSVTLSVQAPHTRVLKPGRYKHALLLKNTVTNAVTTLLTGEFRVAQHSKMLNTDDALFGAGSTSGSGTLNANLLADLNAQQLIDANAQLSATLSSLFVNP